MDDASFADKTFDWFYLKGIEPEDLSIHRATQWLETPMAQAAAGFLTYPEPPEPLLAAARLAIAASEDLPVWETPSEAAQFLRGLLLGLISPYSPGPQATDSTP